MFVLLCIVLFKNPIIVGTVFVSYIFSTILDIINYIVFKEGKDTRFIYAHKSFIKSYNSIKVSAIRGILEISFLPHKAYISFVAIAKTIYRINISKKHLLEWITSEQAEKQAKTDLLSYYRFMIVNLVFGFWFLIFGILQKNIFMIIIGLLWIFAPFISWYISKDIKVVKPIEKITKEDKEYLLEVGKKTWQYFKDNINEENNYLPPDNYQEDRQNKIAPRTSTTNIGLRNVSHSYSL